MSYTEAQQAMAVEIVSRYDGQVTSECLAEVRRLLGLPTLPKVTIYRWLQKDVTDKKPITPEARQQAAKRLDDMFEDLARHALEAADNDDRMEKMNSQQLAMTAAIAVDKMRLLRDLPTEIVGVLPAITKYNDELSKDGLSLGDALEIWFNAYLEEKNKVSVENTEGHNP